MTAHDETLDDAPGGQLLVDDADPTTLVATGEIDVFVVEGLAEHVGAPRTETGRRLAAEGVRTVDVAGAEYIDSGFIGLVASLAAAAAPDRVRVRGASGQVSDVLTLTGLDSLVELV